MRSSHLSFIFPRCSKRFRRDSQRNVDSCQKWWSPGLYPLFLRKGGHVDNEQGLAKEYASKGIRVNAVSPGVIDTPFHETFSTPEAMKNFADNVIPMGRVGRSAEVASVIAFLASDAASYLCGETIEVNGGMLMD